MTEFTLTYEGLVNKVPQDEQLGTDTGILEPIREAFAKTNDVKRALFGPNSWPRQPELAPPGRFGSPARPQGGR